MAISRYKSLSFLRRSLTLDALEPRNLLSADGICPVDEPIAGETAALRGEGEGEGDEDLVGDIIANATVLAINGSGETTGTIDEPSDRDIYEIEGPSANGTVHLLPETEGLMLHVEVLDASGNIVATSAGFFGPDDPIEPLMPVAIEFEGTPGTPYYVSVQSLNAGVGDYSLMVAFAGPPIDQPTADSNLGDDIHSGSLDQSATELTLENGFAEVVSFIDRDADSDAFRFTAQGTMLVLDAFGDVPLRASIFDSEGQLVADSTEFVPDELNNEPIPIIVEAETNLGEEYFIWVGSTKGQRGGYQFFAQSIGGDISIGPDDQPGTDSKLGEDPHGDTPESATQLDLKGMPTESVHSFIDQAGDNDVFAFRATSSNLLIDAHGELPLLITVQDSEGVVILDSTEFFPLEDLNEPTPISLDVSTTFGNDYFLTVRSTAESVGPYEVFVSALGTPIDPVDPTDPNGPDSTAGQDLHGSTPDDATLLTFDLRSSNQTISHIDHAGDIDVFAVQAAGFDLFLDVLSFDPTIELDVEVLDGTGLEVAADINGMGADGSDEGPETLIEGIVSTTPGETYYIAVSGDAPVGYRLGVSNFAEEPVEPVDPSLPDEEVPGEEVPGEEDSNKFDAANPLVGDIDQDGRVQFSDFLVLSQNFGARTDAAFADGDLNGDGQVNFPDFLLLSANYGATAPVDFAGDRTGEEIRLQPGELVQVSPNTNATFEEVVSDSRCPSGVICFWEGQAVVKVTLEVDGVAHVAELVLRSGVPEMAEAEIAGKMVRLLSVDPYPEFDTITDADDYVITLVVE